MRRFLLFSHMRHKKKCVIFVSSMNQKQLFAKRKKLFFFIIFSLFAPSIAALVLCHLITDNARLWCFFWNQMRHIWWNLRSADTHICTHNNETFLIQHRMKKNITIFHEPKCCGFHIKTFILIANLPSVWRKQCARRAKQKETEISVKMIHKFWLFFCVWHNSFHTFSSNFHSLFSFGIHFRLHFFPWLIRIAFIVVVPTTTFWFIVFDFRLCSSAPMNVMSFVLFSVIFLFCGHWKRKSK